MEGLQATHGPILLVADQPNTIGALSSAIATSLGLDVAYLPELTMCRVTDPHAGQAKTEAKYTLNIVTIAGIMAHTSANRKAPTTGMFKASTKLAVAAQTWLDQVGNGPATEGIKTSYRKTVHKHIIPNIGALTLGELSASRVQAFIDTTTRTAGPATGKAARGCLAQIMDLRVRGDAIPTNPVTSTRSPATERTKFTDLTPEHIQSIREHVTAWGKVRCSGPSLLLDLLDTLAATGIRLGEALALRWKDVNLEESNITVSGTIIRAGGGLKRQAHPQTTSSIREVSLPQFAVLILEKRFLRTDNKLLEGPVFPSHLGGWLEASNVQRMWSSAREGGFEDVTFRDYNKAVTALIKQAESMDSVAAQLGLSSPEVTRRHYIERDGRVDFADVVEAALSC